jgi:CBS domain-containing protein
MTRKDAHVGAMLSHLGATYYESLHGRAAPADVTRALNSVAQRLGEKPPEGSGHDRHRPYHGPKHHGRWHSRAGDVMTTRVITADRLTPYKDLARLMTKHRVSGLPVLTMGRHVAGIVSETDLIRARDSAASSHRGHGVLHRAHEALTAEQLMTTPPITVQPDTPVARAARLMNCHHIRRLPVVDTEGKLAGIVSRRDLLHLFLRPDEDIERQAGELLDDVLPGGRDGVEVIVSEGVITLSGCYGPGGERDLLPVAVRLIWDLDGVIDVVNKVA